MKLYKNNVFGKVITDYNIIPDCAGRYNELQKIVTNLGGKYYSLGDMNDRGAHNKEVFDFFMNQKAILGNHEHMLIDTYRQNGFYTGLIWLYNGGFTTVLSFCNTYEEKVAFTKLFDLHYKLTNESNLLNFNMTALYEQIDNNIAEIIKEIQRIIPLKYIEWLESLPLFYENDNMILSHAPISAYKDIDEVCDLGVNCWDSKYDSSIIFNRTSIRPRKNDQFQIYGHNAYHEPNIHTKGDGSIIGMGLDVSASRRLFVYCGIEDSLYYVDYELDNYDANLVLKNKPRK